MAGDGLSVILFALRTGLNVAALLMIGLALHGALGVVESFAFKRYRPLLLSAALLTAILTATRIAMLNVQMGDGATAFDPDLTALSWLALGSSSVAFVAGAVLVSLGAATSRRILLGAGAAVSVGGFALTGHTQALEPPGAMPLAAAAHALIAGFWVVAPLTLQPVRPLLTGELLGRLQRFSTIATIAIPLLVVLGLWLAWILAGGWDRLVGTAYGQLLLLKLAAALAALGIGAFNRQYVTALVGVHPDRGRRLLGRTLAIETVLFATAILAVSAATTLTGAGE